jgi:hypothetical protein
MAAGDTPATLGELQTDFLEKLKEVTGNTAVTAIATRFLNQALQDIHSERWWWAERNSTIRTIAPYTTGTVDVAITDLTARRTVTGTSTLWTTTNTFGDANAVAGYKMTLGGSQVVHKVNAVGGAGTITLETNTPYVGTSALDDATYSLYQDEYALATDFDAPVDLRFFDDERSISLTGAQEFYLRFPRNNQPGQPKLAALIELGPSGSVALRRRVVFGPAPNASYIIPYRYYTTNLAVSSVGVGAANLSATSDQPIVPLNFRSMLVWKALELWAKTRTKQTESAALFNLEYEKMVARARAKTTNADPRPRFQPQIASYWAHRARRPGVFGRYSTGTAFDELRDR